MNSKQLIAGILFVLAGTVVPAGADSLDTIKASKTVRIAVDLGSPPFGMNDSAMQPTGSDVETAKLLAADLGYTLDLVQATSPNRVPFLLTGKADMVVASFSITEERKQVIDFSDPYGVIQIVIAAPKNVAIGELKDTVGKRLGTTRGSSNDKEATTQAQGAEMVRYDDDATLITALISGQVNIMASSPQVMAAVNERRPNDPLEVKLVLKTNPYAIGLRKDDEALRKVVNEWIHTNLKNGKLNAIYKKYNGVELPADMMK
jgi:polar amino acid transport system substrate-binding protein